MNPMQTERLQLAGRIQRSRRQRGDKGFVLIACLLLLALLAMISAGVLMLVNTEGTVSGADVQNNRAYHYAEGGMEKMTTDLVGFFSNVQSPTPAQIVALGNNVPTGDPNVTYLEYTFTPQSDPVTGALITSGGTLTGGPYQGLSAAKTVVALRVTAQTGLGSEVTMVRTVEVALIPVFQFGVFSNMDLGFFGTPNLSFAGRIHTNGDLYLGVADGNTANFEQKITAYGNVIRAAMPNGLPSVGNNNNGTVNVATAAGGCPTTNCRAMLTTEGSVTTDAVSAQNTTPTWTTTSISTYNGMILDGNFGQNGGTGVKALNLPFVSGAPQNQSYQIIRRPPSGESTATLISQSRLANQAEIRVLLADSPAQNHLDGSAVDANDIQLVSKVPAALTNAYAPASPAISEQNGIAIGGNTYYFGESNLPVGGSNCGNVVPAGTGCDADFVLPPKYHGQTIPASGTANGWNQNNFVEWPLIDGWLRVEYLDNTNTWHGITAEWLNLGFARGLQVPTTPGGNAVHANAILVFQQQADRNANGVLTDSNETSVTSGANSQYSWFPINLYDTREGEVRDTSLNNPTCTPNGVMNAVELDVGNLKQWLTNAAGNGVNVNSTKNNGYILYFSDRRGMLGDPNNGNQLMGEYGFEDTINAANENGAPDNALEALPPRNPNQFTASNPQPSPEDVNQNGRLDTYGAANVGDAFGINTNTSPKDPYQNGNRIASCILTGRKNRVTGARHVLKLIDGSLGNVPTMPGGGGGFTVASENPVYVQGNYNSAAPPADPTWTNPAAADPTHAAAGIIADAVTLLSNNWQDTGVSGQLGGSFQYPTTATNKKPATTTYYRVAIAAGKSTSFTSPSGWANAPGVFFGTDGGVQNFLRFLEDWNGLQLWYKGSLVSLYYSTYNTGSFKCCNAVYRPPSRQYFFDTLFTKPANLPPGTPMFRDVDTLGYNQDFSTPR